MTTFQYISDIHLEFGSPHPPIIPSADVLLLAGDIGNPSFDSYEIFLAEMSDLFKQVFVIAGNHEYYGTLTMQGTNELIRSICARYENVVFLQNEAHQVLDTDVWIFGTTLWSRIPNDTDIYYELMFSMSDYKLIPRFTPTISTKLFTNALNSFSHLCAEHPGKRWIVLCHHQPAMHLIDQKYRHSSAINHAFASDAPTLTDPAVAVVYGHTHTPYRAGKFYCNPVGYPGEHEGEADMAATFCL